MIDFHHLNLTNPPLDGFKESTNHTCKFDNINGMVLEKVCEYFYYHEKNRDASNVADLDIPPELCLELLMAADYLNGVYFAFPPLCISC